MTDQSADDTVCPEFDRKNAEALLTYAESYLGADDSFGEFRERVVAACGELDRALESDSHEEGDR